MCYAELGSRVPKAGSGYAYLYHCMGELAGFTIGWCLCLSYIVGASSVAGALSQYLNDITGGFLENYIDVIPIGIPYFRDHINLTAMFILMFLGAILCKGISEASMITNICTIANICTLILISCILLLCCESRNWFWPFDPITDTIEIHTVHTFFNKFFHDDPGSDHAHLNLGEEHMFGSHGGLLDTYCSNKQYEVPYDNMTGFVNYRFYCKLRPEHWIIPENATFLSEKDIPTRKEIDVGYGPVSYPAVSKALNPKLAQEENWISLVNTNLGTGGFFPYNFQSFVTGISTCFYGFVGFDAIATTGEEAINPQKDIPRAIVISLSVICVVYLVISGLLTASFPYFALDAKNPFPATFYYHGFNWVNVIIKIGAICALTSSLLGSVIPMPRILWNMADDGLAGVGWATFFSEQSKIDLARKDVPMKAPPIVQALRLRVQKIQNPNHSHSCQHNSSQLTSRNLQTNYSSRRPFHWNISRLCFSSHLRSNTTIPPRPTSRFRTKHRANRKRRPRIQHTNLQSLSFIFLLMFNFLKS